MNRLSAQSPPNAPNPWGVACRPTILFVAAYALSITPHEAVHALTSYLLGFNSTLFQMWVNPDPASATPRQLAVIAAAGPVFSLAVGVTCWLLYQRRFRRTPAALMFLMLAMVGVYSFLGPLAGSALGGDFNLAFTLLSVPKPALYVLSAIGFVLLPCFMFFMGGKLVGWAPSNFGRANAVACTTVAPWLIGTALILLLYWPLPSFLIGSTLAGSVFWLFAVIGAILQFSTPSPLSSSIVTSTVHAERSAQSGAAAETLRHRAPPSAEKSLFDLPAEAISSFSGWDFTVTLVAVTLVRLLVNGVRLTH